MIYPVAMAAISFGLTFLLSEPGTFLPRTVKLSANVTLQKLETLEHIINESIHYPAAGYSATYTKTYIEKMLGVERPRLNETSVDPDLFKDFPEGSRDRSRLDRSSISKVMKNWDFLSAMGDGDATDAMADRYTRHTAN